MIRKLLLWSIAVIVLAVAGAVATGAVMGWRHWSAVVAEAEKFDLSELRRMPAVSEVFDARGNRYGRLEGETRYLATIDQVPESMIQALIAREDTRFREHDGVDFRGIIRAAWKNWRAGRVEEGASTLTQQLARNTFDLGADKWRRKLVEAALAMRIERHLSKDEILEAYLNRIYFGEGVYGVETASRIYFGKSVAALDLSESAMIAGLIRSPNRFSPLDKAGATLIERDVVLDRMRELEMITPEQAAAAKAMDMPLTKRRLPQVRAGYAMDAIRRELEVLFTPEQRRQGGLRIYTTVDPRLQAIAEGLVDAELRKAEASNDYPHEKRPAEAAEADPTERFSPYVQGALVAIENKTGAIRAIVGGRDFGESPYDRAMLAQRQLGSTFKPFVYAAAFQRGLSPFSPVDDGPIRSGEIAGANASWNPRNSDGDNRGVQPAGFGLVRSRNTMTIRVGNAAGLDAVRKLGVAAGIARDIPKGPAIFLGAFESTLAQVTSAYMTFPNCGVRRQSHLIERIEDETGALLYKAAHITTDCLTPASAWAVHGVLEEVMKSGTGAGVSQFGFKKPGAGKTGTTDDYKDAWFIGYTSALTCGVWVGFDRPQKIMNRGYGSRLALPIWARFMTEAAEGEYEARPFQFLGDLMEARICRTSGRLPTPGCEAAGTVAVQSFPRGTAPVALCGLHGFPAFASGTELPVLRAEPAGEAPVAEPVLRALPVETEGPAYRVIKKEGGMIIYHGIPRQSP